MIKQGESEVLVFFDISIKELDLGASERQGVNFFASNGGGKLEAEELSKMYSSDLVYYQFLSVLVS